VCAAALGAPAVEDEGVAVSVDEELEFHQLRLVASRIFAECEERVKVTRAPTTTQHLLAVFEKAWLDQCVSSLEALCEILILIRASAAIGGQTT
jgi:hypothetical protein